MRLKLASRRSDLARWQAVQVGRALERLPEKPSIEFIFKSSLGDQNLDLPLAQMGAKGVFTEDFYGDLMSGQCDLVVHSWKDLPVEERASTHIAMTLPRADVRDVLIVPDAVWAQAQQTGEMRILTSSPRRVYNLSAALPQLLPGSIRLEFVNVRGNVPTRLQKMQNQAAALVLAKAGLDRLLEAENEGFLAHDAAVKPLIQNCRFQVLPVSLNPPAPAQGALAIEVLRDNETMNAFCASLNDARTFNSVQQEREVLKRYGGGCHQKIGVAVLEREYGRVFSLRGLTTQGETLSEWRIEDGTPWNKAASRHEVFPLEAKDNSWFDRKAIKSKEDLTRKPALFVARADAWPHELKAHANQIVWTAGVQSWIKLARQGVWVNGTNDGLGEQEPTWLDHLVGPLAWVKLSHTGAAEGDARVVPTYQLTPKKDAPDLKGKTHFFWMSGTSFERARQLFPREIAKGYNACGPGATRDFLNQQKGLQHPVKVFAGLEQFLAESVP